MSTEKVYDYIIVGSGFGGSVSAMRLAEKGYDVLVIERGKEYKMKDFPKSNWNIRKFLWAPILKCFGFQNLTFFKDVFILSGVGVGGGSLVYANTHMFPPDAFFQNSAWSRFRDWKKTLTPFYEKARFMLGSTYYAKEYREDKLLKEVATDMGRADSFHHVNVGVYFGEKGENVDPYFEGYGPERQGCTECANCMVGCRHGAKNTLDKNYLYFARKNGAEVLAETLVTRIEQKNEMYEVHTQSATSWFGTGKKVYRSKGLVISGGVLGTLKLLFQQKFDHKSLSSISDTIGENLRTNSESICGVTAAKEKLNHGIAISSVFNPDDQTHIEIVKYGDGSGAMGRLATLAAGEGPPPVRIAKFFGNILTQPIKFLRTALNFNWAKNSIIFLVMQSVDNSMRMVWKRGLFGKTMKIDNKGEQKVPAYIDVGQQVMHRYADKVSGVAMNAITEIAFDMSTTAHILGGCPMGETAETGVVNDRFEVNGYKNMYILDGSIIPCNLGVNPSYTITALSEYAMSLIPDKQGNTRQKLDDLLTQKRKSPAPVS